MLTCEYCKNEYKTKSNLNNHQKTTKKCLMLRGIIESKYICLKCGYKTERKISYDRHNMSCTDKKKKTYDELEQENNNLKLKLEKYEEEVVRLATDNMNLERKIESYESKMFTLAAKPTSINNTNTTNNNRNTQNLIMSDWRSDTIIEKVERGFTLEHLEDGLKGVARFTDEHIIRGEDGKKSLLCTDPARMIFKYKDSEGVVQKDVRATKLKNAIKEPIIKKSKEMFINENSRLFDVINSAEEDENMDFTNAKIDNLRENFLQVKKIDDNSDMYAKELALLANI